MRRRFVRILLILLCFPPLLAGVAGWFAAPAFLHPIRRTLTPDLIREADAAFTSSAGVFCGFSQLLRQAGELCPGFRAMGLRFF
jgi:hypothetical protein